MTPSAPPASTPSAWKSATPPGCGISSGPRTICSTTARPLSCRRHQPAAEVADDLAVLKDCIAADDRPLHDAAERAADIGAKLVTVEQRVVGELVPGRRVDQQQVGMRPGTDPSFVCDAEPPHHAARSEF